MLDGFKLLPTERKIVKKFHDPKIGLIERSQFEVDGFCVKSIISEKLAKNIAQKVEKLYKSGEMINVLRDDNFGVMKFDTINGEKLIAAIPDIEIIYEKVLQYINKTLVDNKYSKIESKKTAISLNRYPEGGSFRNHFDRHEMTVAIMIQQPESGGELEIYPFSKIKVYNDLYESTLMRKIQYLLDKITFRKPILKFIHKKKIINLKNGEGAFFYGTHTIHKALPVKGKTPRITLILAYDLPYRKFKDLNNYYGA